METGADKWLLEPQKSKHITLTSETIPKVSHLQSNSGLKMPPSTHSCGKQLGANWSRQYSPTLKEHRTYTINLPTPTPPCREVGALHCQLGNTDRRSVCFTVGKGSRNALSGGSNSSDSSPTETHSHKGGPDGKNRPEGRLLFCANVQMESTSTYFKVPMGRETLLVYLPPLWSYAPLVHKTAEASSGPSEEDRLENDYLSRRPNHVQSEQRGCNPLHMVDRTIYKYPVKIIIITFLYEQQL